jgi:hypothetical protein
MGNRKNGWDSSSTISDPILVGLELFPSHSYFFWKYENGLTKVENGIGNGRDFPIPLSPLHVYHSPELGARWRPMRVTHFPKPLGRVDRDGVFAL